MKQFEVYISLGSNQGDSIEILNQAIDRIDAVIGKVTDKSSFYESEPWGFEADQNFINAVIKISTEKYPEKVLDLLLGIEKNFGRIRKTTSSYESRPLDLDIIDIDGAVFKSKKLEFPHPRMHLRAFVLVPLNEIEPQWKHPLSGKRIEELIEGVNDNLSLTKVRNRY